MKIKSKVQGLLSIPASEIPAPILLPHTKNSSLHRFSLLVILGEEG